MNESLTLADDSEVTDADATAPTKERQKERKEENGKVSEIDRCKGIDSRNHRAS